MKRPFSLRDLYTEDVIITEELIKEWIGFDSLSKFSEYEKGDLHSGVTQTEVRTTIKASNKGKAAGPDGLQVKIYNALEDTVLGEYLTKLMYCH